MKTILLIVLLLAGSFSAFATAVSCTVDNLDVVPRRPLASDDVTLLLSGHCPDGCVPIHPRVRVDGSTITIAFGSPEGCVLVPTSWSRRVEIGELPPGRHDVVVTYRESVMSRHAVDIAAVSQPFDVLPVSGEAGIEVLLRGVSGCPGSLCSTKRVRFNGVEAGVRTTAEGLVAVVPTLAEGLIDVTVISADGSQVSAPAAFEYTTRFDARDYRRVLFPVTYAGPGAGGSQWMSENVVYNPGPVGVNTIPSIFQQVPPVGTVILFPASLPPQRATTIATSRTDVGALLLVPRGLEHFLRYSSHIRDASRSTRNRGTEIRVVFEEDTASQLRLLRVPADPRFRPRLRVYDIDGNEQRVLITITSSDSAHSTSFHVEPRRSFVCVTTPCEDAALAALDLAPHLAGIPNDQTAEITVSAPDDRRLWAFVTITNNETQEVTTYTPQKQNR